LGSFGNVDKPATGTVAAADVVVIAVLLASLFVREVEGSDTAVAPLRTLLFLFGI
jgi:hypothetical protein